MSRSSRRIKGLSAESAGIPTRLPRADVPTARAAFQRWKKGPPMSVVEAVKKAAVSSPQVQKTIAKSEATLRRANKLLQTPESVGDMSAPSSVRSSRAPSLSGLEHEIAALRESVRHL